MNRFRIIVLIFIFYCGLFAQDEIKNYKPPKVMKGSRLELHAISYFTQSDDRYSVIDNYDYSKRFSSGATFDYTRWKYSDKLNYIINFSPEISYSFHKYIYSTNQNLSLYTSLEGGINYYLKRNIFYAGVNGSGSCSFRSSSKPSFSSYLGPNIGIGKIINASQTERTYNLEKLLKNEEIISGNLPYNIKVKLTQLFDRRNNREFYYKFKDDDEINFYSDVEKLLNDEGIIKGPLGARTVLKIFQMLTNDKFLYYPKYKGYQVQLLLYAPFISKFSVNPYQLILSEIYGLPFNYKTSMVLYGSFSKTLHNDTALDLSSYRGIRNIFFLSSDANKKEKFVPTFPGEYYIDHYRFIPDYAIRGSVTLFHNFSEFFGLRAIVWATYDKTTDTLSRNNYLSQAVILDYAVLSKMILTASISSYQNFLNKKVKYSFNAEIGVNYIIF